MNSPIKRKLLIPVVAVAALGGGAAAVAATSSSSSSSSSSSNRQAYIDSVAKHLGVSSGTLAAAMQAAAIERVEGAVAAGRLTKSEAQAIERRIKEGRGPLFRMRFGGGAHGVGGLGLMRVAVGYLGISADTLHSDRRAGKSLAEIAASTPGKSVLGLKAALLAAAKQRVSAAVSSGRLTSQQAQEIASRLPARIERMINRAGIMHSRPMHAVPGLGPGGPGA